MCRNCFGRHRWARLLKQQMLITVYCLLTKKTNFRFPFPFEANKRKFALSVYRLQQTNRSCRFPLVPYIYIDRQGSWDKTDYISRHSVKTLHRFITIQWRIFCGTRSCVGASTVPPPSLEAGTKRRQATPAEAACPDEGAEPLKAERSPDEV